jgi:PadR family transcriptional regulator PadR
MASELEIVRGTLDLLILKSLGGGAAHGYAIARWIEWATADALRVGEGSLYPALQRLETRGWVRAEWGASEANRRAKYYTLTREGRARLRVELDTWARFTQAVQRALEAPVPMPVPAREAS